MDICFVLVAPALAANIGAAARAVKTMGFCRLRLAGACPHHENEALWTAHGSRDILDAAQIFDTLEEAVADRDFVIATTARRRGLRHEYYPPESLVPLIRGKDAGGLRAALVFGPEERGLSNAELALCDCVSSVPLAAAYPSLNLAQAVMIYAYVLSPLVLPPQQPRGETPLSEDASFRALKNRAAAVLARLEPAGDLVSRRILERLAALNGEDIKLAHSLCARLEKSLAAG
ncbi:MAG: tRNA/rRNA methyltransferase [Spirochaetales bacterium]|jgi:tRNA/rRNA methyltransferase|nr:tRNA/rRNA methyltransferase [Spirochaetales bacterium]